MAQFAPVCPIQILEEMQRQKVIGKYHLFLAHHTLEHPDRFALLTEDMERSTIIMDNSLVELKEAASDDKTLEACEVINSKHWVIPVLRDVMGDGKASREATTESYDWWKNNTTGYPLMAVAQGKDWDDYTQSIDYLLLSGKFPDIQYVGIPRILVKNLGTRQMALQYVEAVAPQIAVHMLGFSDDVCDDVICASGLRHIVEGIDSAVPIRYSYNLAEGVSPIYTPSIDIAPRPEDWFEKGVFDEASYTNLANIRKWVA